MQGEHQISLLQTRSDPFPGMRGLETFNFYGDRVRFDWQSTPENHITKAPFHLSTFPLRFLMSKSSVTARRAQPQQCSQNMERKGREGEGGRGKGKGKGKGKERKRALMHL